MKFSVRLSSIINFYSLSTKFMLQKLNIRAAHLSRSTQLASDASYFCEKKCFVTKQHVSKVKMVKYNRAKKLLPQSRLAEKVKRVADGQQRANFCAL